MAPPANTAAASAVQQSRLLAFVNSMATDFSSIKKEAGSGLSGFWADLRKAYSRAASAEEQGAIIEKYSRDLMRIKGDDLNAFLDSVDSTFGNITAPHNRYAELKQQGNRNLLGQLASSEALPKAKGDTEPKHKTFAQLSAEVKKLKEKKERSTEEEAKLKKYEKQVNAIGSVQKALTAAITEATADNLFEKVSDSVRDRYPDVNPPTRKAVREHVLNQKWQAIQNLPPNTSLEQATAEIHSLGVMTKTFLEKTADEQLKLEIKAIERFYKGLIDAEVPLPVNAKDDTPAQGHIRSLMDSGLISPTATPDKIREKLGELRDQTIEAAKANNKKSLEGAISRATHPQVALANQIVQQKAVMAMINEAGDSFKKEVLNRLPKVDARERKAAAMRTKTAEINQEVNEKYDSEYGLSELETKAAEYTTTETQLQWRGSGEGNVPVEVEVPSKLPEGTNLKEFYGETIHALIDNGEDNSISREDAQYPGRVLDILNDRKQKEKDAEIKAAEKAFDASPRGVELSAGERKATYSTDTYMKAYLETADAHGGKVKYGKAEFHLENINKENGTCKISVKNLSNLEPHEQRQAVEQMAMMMKAQGFTSCEWSSVDPNNLPTSKAGVEDAQAQTRKMFEADQRQGMKGSIFKSVKMEGGKVVECTYANPADFPDGKLPKGYTDINELYAPEKAPQNTATRSLEGLVTNSSATQKAEYQKLKAGLEREIHQLDQDISARGPGAPSSA